LQGPVANPAPKLGTSGDALTASVKRLLHRRCGWESPQPEFSLQPVLGGPRPCQQFPWKRLSGREKSLTLSIAVSIQYTAGDRQIDAGRLMPAPRLRIASRGKNGQNKKEETTIH